MVSQQVSHLILFQYLCPRQILQRSLSYNLHSQIFPFLPCNLFAILDVDSMSWLSAQPPPLQVVDETIAADICLYVLYVQHNVAVFIETA